MQRAYMPTAHQQQPVHAPFSPTDPEGLGGYGGFGAEAFALRPSSSSSSLGSLSRGAAAQDARLGSSTGGGGGGWVGVGGVKEDGAEQGRTLARVVPRLLLAVALMAGAMLVSSETMQLSGTALFWPCTPIAALCLALNPPWMRRWLAAALLLTYVLMVLLDHGKVHGALVLNVLFLLTDAAEVLSVTLCLAVLLPGTPPGLIRTGAALNAIMLFPLLLAPLKEGLNCLLIHICFSALRMPLWETLLIWLIGDFFMDFFVLYAVLVVRYYWLARNEDDRIASNAAAAAAAQSQAAVRATTAAIKGEGAEPGGRQEDAMDEAEAGRLAAVVAGKQPPSPPPSAREAPAPANAWACCCACCRGWGASVYAAVERALGPTLAGKLASPRWLADAFLFFLLLAVLVMTSFASILNKSRVVQQPLFYLCSRLLFPVIGYATVRYGQLGACFNVAVAALSMLVTDFVVDEEQKNFGAVSASSSGALFQVLVCPVLVVIVAWSISYLAVALVERQDTLLLLKEKNAQLVAQGRELREAKQAAEAALSSKSEFFARVSHEFRTPLNVVLGFSEELTKCPDLALTPETADRIHYILAAGESLLRVVDDILELFRLSSTSSRGRLRIQLTGVDVPSFFSTVCDLVEAIALENGQHFIRHLDPSLPRYLYLDRVRFSQLVMNLASNACKYSRPAGGVVSIRLINEGPVPDRPNHVTLRLDVQDNGPGIPPELKERIFESFFRAGDPTAPAPPTAMPFGSPPTAARSPLVDGRDVAAGAGGGGAFAFPPASASVHPVPPLPAGAGGGGAAALVGMDGLPSGLGGKAKGHGLGLAITKQLVDLLGGRIVVQSSLGLGSLFTIYLAARVASGPTAEGEEVLLEEVEEEEEGGEGGGGGAALVAAGRSSSSSSAGVAVRRPASPPLDGGVGPGVGVLAETPVRELRILSVEDILVNQIVLGGMLQQDGHTVAFVETGSAALAAVHDAAAGGNPFDVVLLDLQLPDMHGIDVLKALRTDADPALAGLPVVVVSALALDREKQECALAGADGFITKPVKLTLLRKELRRLWESGRLPQQRRRRREEPAAAEGEGEVNPPQPAAVDTEGEGDA